MYHTPSTSAGSQTQAETLFRMRAAAMTMTTRTATAPKGACDTASLNIAMISCSADPMTSPTLAIAVENQSTVYPCHHGVQQKNVRRRAAETAGSR